MPFLPAPSRSHAISKWNWIAVLALYLLFCAPSGLATLSSTFQSEWAHSSFSEAAAESDITTIATVKGTAAIERRSTVVPLLACEEEMDSVPCLKSHPYWVLTLVQDGVKYQLDTIYAMGKEERPDYVDVSGAIIRPGSEILLEGQIQLISPGFALIRDLKRIDLVMD
jgi:hypothetical protein